MKQRQEKRTETCQTHLAHLFQRSQSEKAMHGTVESGIPPWPVHSEDGKNKAASMEQARLTIISNNHAKPRLHPAVTPCCRTNSNGEGSRKLTFHSAKLGHAKCVIIPPQGDTIHTTATYFNPLMIFQNREAQGGLKWLK